MKNTSSVPSVSPRIYVACLAAYNAGILHGCWIDADQDADAIHEEMRAMLTASPVSGAEEWAIHDFEGFGSVRLSESESFEKVSKLAVFIEEHGKTGLALLSHHSGDSEEVRRSLDNYLGTYASLSDYAEGMMEGVKIPEAIASYVDYQRMGEDMEMNGDIFTIKAGHDEILVFLSR